MQRQRSEAMALHPKTIEAIGAYHEKRKLLERLRNEHLCFIAKLWAMDGMGWEDICAHTEVPREIARAVVLGRVK